MSIADLRSYILICGIAALFAVAGPGCSRPSDINSAPTAVNSAKNSAATANSAEKAVEMPSEDAVEDLVRDSIEDLADAIQTGDFSELYKNASPDFRSTFTLEQVKEDFQPYIEKKDQIAPILKQSDNVDAEFDPALSIRTEKGLKILVANGVFETTPQKLRFETEYVSRAGEWQMLSLVLNVK